MSFTSMPKYFLLLIFPLLISSWGCDQSGVSQSPEDTFQRILTDSTLNQWSGKSGYWRFDDDILIGEITPENILIENTFFIWEGETGPDFELKAEYRISGRGNSGINYRSKASEEKDYTLLGYQADFDGANEYTGNIYDEKGRGTLAERGQVIYFPREGSSTTMARTDKEAVLLSPVDTANGSWNEYHIIANGNTIMQLINGHIMCILIDESDSKTSGNKLGFQLHLGPPMKVEFRNIRLKRL